MFEGSSNILGELFEAKKNFFFGGKKQISVIWWPLDGPVFNMLK